MSMNQWRALCFRCMSVSLFSDHLSESCLINPPPFPPHFRRQVATIHLAPGRDLYHYRRGYLQALCQMDRILMALKYVCSGALRELVY
jgi:hypothetical protein